MSFPILGTPKPQFFDSSGSPLVSGTLSILDPADDTNKASYPTADLADAGSTPNSNPITLDSRGEPSSGLFGRDGEDYKLVLKDSAGSTIWTVDDINVPVVFYPVHADETTAGITPSNKAYPVGNVKRYGAAGDGTTDDTTACQNAIDVAETTTAKEVFFPVGTYECTSALIVKDLDGVSLLGVGEGSRIDNSTSGNTLEIGDDTTQINDITIQKLMITNSVTGGTCIYARKAPNTRISNCQMSVSGGVTGYGVRLEEAWASTISNNTFASQGTTVSITDSTHGVWVAGNRMDGVATYKAIGVEITGAGHSLNGNIIETMEGCGIIGVGCNGFDINGNYFENNAKQGLTFTGDART